MTSKPTLKSSQGFTLIEILTVIVIIGFLASMVVLSSGGDPLRKIRQEAQRARAVIRLAEDNALIQGKEYGLKINEKSYQIVTFNEIKRLWQSDETNAFKMYRLPDTITLSLQSEGNQISLKKIFNQDQHDPNKVPKDPLRPALLILSSGETTPFKIGFRSSLTDSYITLSSDGLGESQVQTQHE